MRFGLLAVGVTSWLCLLSQPVRASQPEGQQLFAANCSACHGLDGRGGEHAPNIATNTAVQRMTDSGLTQIVKNGIPSAGMPSFARSLQSPQISAVVGYLRLLQGLRGHGALPGSPEAGREIFFSVTAGCSQCHMVNGSGGFIAADLSTFGASHTPTEIQEAIVSPDKNFDFRRGTVEVTTKDGQTLTGHIRNEDNFSLQMQSDDGVFHFFEKADLTKLVRQSRSGMPTNYGSRLSRSDLNDLISFLMQSSKGDQKQHADDDDE